jgi:hypothetical protein
MQALGNIAPAPLVDLADLSCTSRPSTSMMRRFYNNLTVHTHWRTHGYQGSGMWSIYGVYLTLSQDRQIIGISWGWFQVALDHIYLCSVFPTVSRMKIAYQPTYLRSRLSVPH